MDKNIVCKLPGGGVSVIDPAIKYVSALIAGGATEADALSFIASKDAPANSIATRITDVSNIPSDRTFRDAWTDDRPTETVDVDMAKARAVWRDKIRAARKPELERLDVLYNIASERSDTATMADIAAQRQALRDAPDAQEIKDAATPQALKAYWPSNLPARS